MRQGIDHGVEKVILQNQLFLGIGQGKIAFIELFGALLHLQFQGLIELLELLQGMCCQRYNAVDKEGAAEKNSTDQYFKREVCVEELQCQIAAIAGDERADQEGKYSPS